MKTIERKMYRAEELPEKLAPIVDAIRSVYEPEKIILYGSAAQGGDWHDLDLLVIAETEDRFFQRLENVALALAKIDHVATDIFVFTPAEMGQRVKENRFFVVEEILKKGKVVHERN